MQLSYRTSQHISERLCYENIPPSRPQTNLHQDALTGLMNVPRALSPKYFYDARGSILFDQICDTPEYYLTRAEDALLERHARDIIHSVRPHHIIELGSGTSRKTRHLFDACAAEECHSFYAPFDVCNDVLLDSGRRLVSDYEWLHVTALVGDYHAGLNYLPAMEGTRLFVFLGSTIGNFTEAEAVFFLEDLVSHMKPNDRLLIGADRVKDPAILHAAYNDKAGITAAFNRNLLHVLNRELDADFDASGFHHHACYSPRAQQVEMYLVAEYGQRVTVGALNAVLEIAEGESIHTEISRKFTPQGLTRLLGRGGLALEQHFQPGDHSFSLMLARNHLES